MNANCVEMYEERVNRQATGLLLEAEKGGGYLTSHRVGNPAVEIQIQLRRPGVPYGNSKNHTYLNQWPAMENH